MLWVHSLRSLVSYRVKHSKRNPIYIYISTCAHELFPIRDGVLVWFVMTFGTHLMHMLFLNSSPLMEQRDLYSLLYLDMGHGTGVMWFDDVGRCGSRIRYSVVDTKDGEGATVGTGKMPVCVVIPPGKRFIFKYLIWKRDTISNLFLLSLE